MSRPSFARALLSVQLAALASTVVLRAEPVVTATKTDTLTQDANGNGLPNSGDAITYTIVLTNSGDVDAVGVEYTDTIDDKTTLIPGSFATTSLALDDAYSATGNVQITVPAPGVLDNDVDLDGGPVAAIAVIGGSSANGGDVTLAVDGGFTYNPPPGFEGNDAFTYTIEDLDGNTDTATVTIAVADMIWFVDADALCASGDGRITNPFCDLAVGVESFDVNAADDPGDRIVVADGSYNGGLTLLNDQRLIGDGSSGDPASVMGIALAPHSSPLPAFGGTDPVLGSIGDTIAVGQGNTVRGLTLNPVDGTGVRGAAVGVLAVGEVSISGGGGMDIDGGELAVTLDALSVDSAAAPGLRLIDVSGSFGVVDSAGTLSVVGAPAVDIAGAGGGVLVDMPFTSVSSTNSGSFGVRLTNLSGASRFDGGWTSVIASADDGVSLSNAGGTTVTFLDLDIDNFMTNRRGLSATNVGAINVMSGVIDGGAAGAVAIETAHLDITLTRVVSVGGSSPGVDLRSTTGTFTVTGDGVDATIGGNGSGGTISNKTGADGSSNGVGVWLDGATGVALHRMRLADFSNHAVRGANVVGFALSHVTIDGVSGTSVAFDEGAVRFENLGGVGAVERCDVSGGLEDNVRVVNTAGSLSLDITESRIGDSGNDGVLVEARSAAGIGLTVTDCDFTSAAGDLLQVNAIESASMGLEILGNRFSNDHASIVSGGGGVTIAGGGGGSNVTLTYRIDGNRFRDARGIALNVHQGAGAGSFNGEITSNTVGVAGAALSGSSQAGGVRVSANGTGTHSVWIDGNAIHQTNETGLHLSANDGASALNATVTDNIVDEPGDFTFAGVFIDAGALNSDANVICADVGGGSGEENSFVGSGGAFGFDFQSATSANATIRLPGLVGDSAAVAGYIQGRNVGTPSVDASGNYDGTVGSCPLPALGATGEEDIRARATALQRAAIAPPAIPAPSLAAGVVVPVATLVLSAALRSAADVDATGGVASGETIMVTVGALPPGKSIEIAFGVVLDDGSLADFDFVCNQGVVRGDNFADVLTDDPDVGGAADPTCTLAFASTGACCLGGGSCEVMSRRACLDNKDDYRGDNVACVPLDPCVCGDLDHDADVDDWDYQLFVAAWGHVLGENLYNADADYDRNGVITLGDYEVWLECYRDFVDDPGAIPSLPRPGDYDADFDYDLDDYRFLWGCMTAFAPEFGFSCRAHYVSDAEDTIDLRDYANLQRLFTGPER